MKSKTIVNGKGEPQATRIEITIEGSGVRWVCRQSQI